jgi:flagellar hook-basal body complex protein FliE
MAITSIGGMLTTVPGASAPQSDAGAGNRFSQALSRLVEDSEEAGHDANVKVAAMLDGGGDVHDAMIAMQRADLSLQMTVQVRNKLMNAYNEIMRMPV